MSAESSIDPSFIPPGQPPVGLWLRCPKCRAPLAEIVAFAGWERLRIGAGYSTGDKTKIMCSCGAVKVFYPRRVM